MIFLEDTLKRNRDYRSLMDDVERRVFGCGRDESGQFAPKNDCQDDGKGGGGSQPAKSDSWKTSSKDVSLDKKQLQESSPLSDPGDIESLQIGQPKAVAATMSRLGVGSLDDVVAIGGGTIRGAMVSISDLDDEAVTVSISAPVDPSDPQSPRSTATVMLMEGFDGETVADYSDFHPGGNLSDASQQEGGQNSTRRLRVASILKQRMLESLVAAEKTGVSKAVSMAVGKKDDPRVKGYRLWPVFGFDAKVPRSLMAKIPDEMLLRAAGVDIPSQGTGRIPRSVVIKNLRQQVKEVTVQQLMKFRDGENWWTENGGSIELSLDLTDKDSLGYKKFQEELKKLPQLRKRNEGRSWYPIDEYEARSVDCGRVEGGRFGPKNDCQDDGKGGGSTAAKAPSRAKRESWRKSEEENIFLGARELAENSPVIGGERLAELTIQRPKVLADTLDKLGVKDLDTAVKIGGGAIRDAEVRVKPWGGGVAIRISSPVDPEDLDAGSVQTSVDIDNYGDGLEVNYGGLNTPGRVSDAERLEAGTSDKTRLRIASLLQERMIESLMAAEKAKVVKATTYAAGSKGDSIYAGYRLWPQFGFDTKLDLSEFKVPDEVILASFKMAVPPSPQAAARAAEALTRNGYTLQRLISTREGKLWWDENGSGTDMTLDLRDKKSLGYKRFAKLKKILPRLKDRNTAEGRSILGWIIEEVTRRSMSLVGFLGGLAGAVERRDCGPSDKDESGRFTKGNDCQEGAGEGGSSVAQEAAKAKTRDVDVMLAGGKRVAVMDKEARDRAVEDFKARPGKGGSTTDLWDREFVRRGEGKRKNKIESTDPVFPESDLRQNGQFVAHEAVGQYLSNRHEEERRKTGAEGPGAIIDTSASEIPEAQMKYLVDSLTEDAIHAYDVLGVNPGFYSSDLEDTMRQMTGRYPEFADDDNAKFIFTTLLAITSTGQGPDANLRDADDLYRMFREHGTVVPTNYGGGARDVTASLRVFQGLIDSFGKDRTRRLLSGYTTVGKIEKAFESLAGKAAVDEWRARTGSSPWSLPVDSKGKRKEMVSGELRDEIVPIAAIFGPKIGSFNANLSGRHDFLTMDRWLMRSVGRVSGELITRMKPEGAMERAKSALDALNRGKWSKAKLFGVDKTHGITKAALIRSLKIQARTGVIEENGAAFIWARAAERSHGKTKRPSGGGYGQHPDPEIHDLHTSGNSIFKALIQEQQDPKTATARRNIREVFRRVQSEIKSRTGREADIDEIQAALWQYEKRLWKHLGTKTNIEENSLFSSAAEGVTSGRIKREKPFTPASRRDFQEQEDYEDDFDVNPFDAEQDAWESNLAGLDIDLLEVLRMLEEDVEERRNFAALDAVVEVRADDCGRDDGGRFGPKNQCQEEGSGSDEPPPPSWATDIEHSMKKSRGYDDPANKLAWLNLSGTFYPVSGDHGEFALSHGVKGGGEDLLDAGWLRVAGVGAGTLYVGNSSGKPPKKSQISALRDFAISTGSVTQVVFDDGRSRRGRVLWSKDESRSADCGRDEGGKFGDGNTCAKSGDGPSNSKGESFRGVRRKSDKTQTKVARKLFQMRVPEKNLKSLVRNLGGKVSNTLVEIDSTKGDEGVNVFVRDRDNNETHYIHIGYYGANVYTTETVSPQEVSRIQAAAKEFLPKTIDNRLWGAGSEYPVYVVNSPEETAKQWSELSAKQRLKKERRSADCGRDEGGRFGPKNQCQEEGYGLSVKSEKSADAWGKETYTVGGTTKGNYRYSIKDPDTGGSASLKVEAYTDYSDGDFDPKGTAVTIVTWNATPLSAIAQEGLIAQEKYVGKGFGRRVFSQALEIAKEHDADVISVFGPSDDTLAVLKKYTAAGVISPIESSKAVSGDFHTDYRIDKSKVDEFLAETKRRKKQSRSADCGRDEGGRFGPKNQCQDDGQGGGAATAAKSKPSSPLDTNENKTWTPDDGDEPFEGASRFSEVRASGGKRVAESLAKTGISPGKALDATGAPDGADIWMRPAPEFSSQFDSPPVMVNFEADVAGVDRGLSGSSVIGSVNGETVVYHSVFDASPSVQSDPAKRHIAARALYRTMVASIEAARKNGIAEIKFNAAGVSSEKSPSAFRGYTIWPRMGFDAKLPDRIRAKLPESLSHATSLLDLHATREGTKWWAENGEDIDVSFRVGDRSSPQSKIMDRFIQHFMKERREMPLGTGDDWLSPEDLLRLDEMWQEVWDEGDLDDYEYNDADS